MNYLIFCSFEVGGLPYKLAEILNRNGVKTFYLSINYGSTGHDSTSFHYGDKRQPWDLTDRLAGCRFSRARLVRELKAIKQEFNIMNCLATGEKAYLLKEAGIDYNYWSFGADLDQFCFNPVWTEGYPLWKKILKLPYLLLFVKNQSIASIHNSDSILIAPYQYSSLQKIGYSGNMFFLPHCFEIEDYEQLAQKRIDSQKYVCRKLGINRYFFSSTRQFWFGNNKFFSDNKGNDVVLKSFSEYLRLSNDDQMKLILVEKGPDVSASKSLARALGIENAIIWVSEMRRQELKVYYQGATICFGQFGTPVLAFSALEPMANACVCVSFVGDVMVPVPFYKTPPPLINSRNPKQIAEQIYRFLRDSNELSLLQLQSWQWVKENCNEDNFIGFFKKSFT
ncbi:MAG: hypothetical protein GQF41_3931 [Candidatus Rifleibacterium amylolyticum]|nr:MAG: hypothetical protein GQF41_3931 [Candidatus Rifleibacterium amylolyticum]